MTTPPANDDRPSLLLFGEGEPMLDALRAALARHAIVTEDVSGDSAVPAVLANVPDLTVFVGEAASAERAARLLNELREHPLTSSSPVALLSEDASLDARLRAVAHGALTIVGRVASADAMARELVAVAVGLFEDEGPHEHGELAEASVDDLVQILGKELRSGILSVSQSGGERAERFVVRAGQPMREAIQQFITRVRPLIADAKPLQYAFHEAPLTRLLTLDDEDSTDAREREALKGRRFLLIANNPAHADALAQELRANDCKVVVAAADGSGWTRAHDLDPEVALIDEDGLNSWGFDAVARLRKDPQLRWASLLVMDTAELLPPSGPPRIEQLATNVARLLEPDRALRETADKRATFDARLETIGPTRLLRTLLDSGAAWNLTARPRGGATVLVALAEGLVAGASATLPDGSAVEGAGALAGLLLAGAGRLRAEPATHPAQANLLMPLDEAIRAAHAEGGGQGATRSPSRSPSVPPPARRSSVPGLPTERLRQVAGSTETDALVGELHELVGELRDALTSGAPTVSRPPPPPAPKTGLKAAPKPPKSAALAAAIAEAESATSGAPRGPALAPPAPRANAASARAVSAKPPAPRRPLPMPSKSAAGAPSVKAPAALSAPRGSAAAKSVNAKSATPPKATSVPPTAPPPPSRAARRPSAPPPISAAARRSVPPSPPPGVALGVTKSAKKAKKSKIAPPTMPAGLAELANAAAPAAQTKPAFEEVPTTPKSIAPLPAAARHAHDDPREDAASAPPSASVPALAASTAVSSPSVPAGLPVPVSPTLPKAVSVPPPPPVALAAPVGPPKPSPPVELAPEVQKPTTEGENRLTALLAGLPAALPPWARTPKGAAALAGGGAFVLVALLGLSGAFSSDSEAEHDLAGAMAGDLAAAAPAASATNAVAIGAPREAQPGAGAAPGASAPTQPPSAPSPAPEPAPAAPGAEPSEEATAAPPEAPRLPSVDPGPMPSPHAGAAATLNRYRSSLARGARARSRGDLETALGSYRLAIHLKPRSDEAAEGIARTYLEASQFQDALRWAERTRDLEVDDIDGQLLIGDALFGLGRHDEAMAAWRRAGEMSPRSRAPEERIRRAQESLED